MKPEIIANVHVSLEGPDIVEKYCKSENPQEAYKRMSDIVGTFPLDSYLTIHAKKEPVKVLPKVQAYVHSEDFGVIHHMLDFKWQSFLCRYPYGSFIVPYEPWVHAHSEEDYKELKIQRGEILTFDLKETGLKGLINRLKQPLSKPPL